MSTWGGGQTDEERGALPRAGLGELTVAPEDLRALQDPVQEERARRARAHHRETVTIPRLRVLGSAVLVGAIVLHNVMLLGDLQGQAVFAYAALWVAYLVASKVALARFYEPDARLDLGQVFLAMDVAMFVLAIYVSGGERSWLYTVLCVRVADQLGTSQRRAFIYATWALFLHTALVLYMAYVEARPFSLVAELAKVAMVYMLNVYLSFAASPGERQRKRANHVAQVARELIDALRQRTAQLEVARVRAEAASQAKSVFLSNMSHEIRTPMTAVLGMSELLLSEPLRPRERDMAETILSAGRSLLALVNDVLDMSKIEAGELTLSEEDMDLARVLEGALSPMRVLAADKGLGLTLEVDDLPRRMVRGDALRLKQVLLNLIGNAIKFTSRGGVTLSVRVVDRRADGLRVRIEVSDTGIGMTDEQLGRAFEPFQQADDSTTRRFGGTGLGLSIARRLVGLMGGRLHARSEPGRGSTFAFELDLALGSERASLAPVEGRPAVELLRERAPHVLVAEDTEVNRFLLARMLRHLGCTVDSVNDGAAAVERLAGARRYDVIFMDWHMPVMDGLEAVARIRRDEAAAGKPPTPVVGVTASAFADEVARCREAGMDVVLSKPLIWSELERALCRFTLDASQRARISDRPEGPRGPDARVDHSLLQELAAMDPNPVPLLRGMFDDLFASVELALGQLGRAIATGDHELVVARAHALKGSAANLGAVRLAACLSELEHQARQHDPAMPDALEGVRDELSETRAAVADELAGFVPTRVHHHAS